MNEKMKIMIAYDGSPYADAAIEDLRRAGLPEKGEALVASVADLSKTAIANSYEIGVLGKFVSSKLVEKTIELTMKESAQLQYEVEKLAVSAAERVHEILPRWRVCHQTTVGGVADELLKTAAEWKPDLIIVGSHGRTALGRFFLGSVSKEIAERARCSVRVVRQTSAAAAAAPNKVIIGASSLPDAEEVIRAVGRRKWSLENTEMRLIVADDGISAGRISAVYPYAKAIFEQSVEELQRLGLEVSVVIRSGATDRILLEEAKIWNADSIFVFNEKTRTEKGLGELATSLITSAKCPVEVLR
jgi:nucleotide-binding universal stress UspA family protein